MQNTDFTLVMQNGNGVEKIWKRLFSGIKKRRSKDTHRRKIV
jgi:hypothetical protein